MQKKEFDFFIQDIKDEWFLNLNADPIGSVIGAVARHLQEFDLSEIREVSYYRESIFNEEREETPRAFLSPDQTVLLPVYAAMLVNTEFWEKKSNVRDRRSVERSEKLEKKINITRRDITRRKRMAIVEREEGKRSLNDAEALKAISLNKKEACEEALIFNYMIGCLFTCEQTRCKVVDLYKMYADDEKADEDSIVGNTARNVHKQVSEFFKYSPLKDEFYLESGNPEGNAILSCMKELKYAFITTAKISPFHKGINDEEKKQKSYVALGRFFRRFYKILDRTFEDVGDSDAYRSCVYYMAELIWGKTFSRKIASAIVELNISEKNLEKVTEIFGWLYLIPGIQLRLYYCDRIFEIYRGMQIKDLEHFDIEKWRLSSMNFIVEAISEWEKVMKSFSVLNHYFPFGKAYAQYVSERVSKYIKADEDWQEECSLQYESEKSERVATEVEFLQKQQASEIEKGLVKEAEIMMPEVYKAEIENCRMSPLEAISYNIAMFNKNVTPTSWNEWSAVNYLCFGRDVLMNQIKNENLSDNKAKLKRVWKAQYHRAVELIYQQRNKLLCAGTSRETVVSMLLQNEKEQWDFVYTKNSCFKGSQYFYNMVKKMQGPVGFNKSYLRQKIDESVSMKRYFEDIGTWKPMEFFVKDGRWNEYFGRLEEFQLRKKDHYTEDFMEILLECSIKTIFAEAIKQFFVPKEDWLMFDMYNLKDEPCMEDRNALEIMDIKENQNYLEAFINEGEGTNLKDALTETIFYFEFSNVMTKNMEKITVNEAFSDCYGETGSLQDLKITDFIKESLFNKILDIKKESENENAPYKMSPFMSELQLALIRLTNKFVFSGKEMTEENLPHGVIEDSIRMLYKKTKEHLKNDLNKDWFRGNDIYKKNLFYVCRLISGEDYVSEAAEFLEQRLRDIPEKVLEKVYGMLGFIYFLPGIKLRHYVFETIMNTIPTEREKDISIEQWCENAEEYIYVILEIVISLQDMLHEINKDGQYNRLIAYYIKECGSTELEDGDIASKSGYALSTGRTQEQCDYKRKSAARLYYKINEYYCERSSGEFFLTRYN